MDSLSPTQLSRAAGISVPYASQILSGLRNPSLAVALRAYDALQAKIGPLADLSESEIETARKMRGAA